MTEMITYEHSNGVTLDLPVLANSMQLEGIIEGQSITTVADKGTSIVNDPNRRRRRMRFSCVLSRANTITMEGYMVPASSPVDGTYPRFKTWYRGDATTETNVKVVNTGWNHRYHGRDGTDIQYIWTFTFEEIF